MWMTQRLNIFSNELKKLENQLKEQSAMPLVQEEKVTFSPSEKTWEKNKKKTKEARPRNEASSDIADEVLGLYKGELTVQRTARIFLSL